MDNAGRWGGETEDGRLGPGGREASDHQRHVHLHCEALRGLQSPELDGRRAAEEHELQRILPDLPHCCKEFPQGMRIFLKGK